MASSSSSFCTADESTTTAAAAEELSTYEILEAAARRIISMMSSTSQSSIDLCSLMKNPFDLSSQSGLSYQEATKVELVEYLMAAAEKVGNRHHGQALDLLDLCDCLSSKTGDPVQRLAYYFSQSLRERISRESRGKIIIDGSESDGQRKVNAAAKGSDEWLRRVAVPTIQSVNERVPFYRVSQLAGIQILLENVGGSRRIHVIDLEIRTGVQWTAMMQALASRSWDRPVELFKVTAVGLEKSRKSMEETGRQLASFAQTLAVTFCFRIVTVDDVLDLREEMFDIGDDPREALPVHCEHYLRSLIASPDRMEGLMKVIRGLRPRIVVVLEIESNHNSMSLTHRFVEALFSFASVFDFLEMCMDREGDAERRAIFESMVLGERIRSVVVEEGEERCFRTVRIDVWRTLLARFGMVESKLSAMILYQAKLVASEFPCGKYCKVVVNGKSLIAGWKETPMISISGWKFARSRKSKEEEISG